VIATSASNAEARKYALEALGRNLHALEALPSVASRLADPEAGVRFYALNPDISQIVGKRPFFVA
jgi:hypothetical protein